MTHHLPQWLSAIFSSFHFNFYPAIFAFVPICFFPMTFIESRLAYRVVISMQGIQILVNLRLTKLLMWTSQVFTPNGYSVIASAASQIQTTSLIFSP